MSYLLLFLGEYHVRGQPGLEALVVPALLAELPAVDGDPAVAVEGTHEALLVGVDAMGSTPEESPTAEAGDATIAANVFLKLG